MSVRGRLPAVGYIASKLSKKTTAENQSQFLGESLPLMVRERERERGGGGGRGGEGERGRGGGGREKESV